METDSLQLDEIVNWIDTAFGEVTPEIAQPEVDALKQVFGSSGYQRYLQDQVNRRIIRDYLTNAVVLGEISQGGLAAFASQLVSEDSRAALALFMLMSSVEEAKDLPLLSGDTELLKPLPCPSPSRAHIKLVPN
jgi:hypothetical protein